MRFEEGNNTDFLLHRYRFSVNLQPMSWLQLYGELQDARAAWLPNPDASVKDRLDIRQAYVTLGGERVWWDLKVGRQKFSYGATERMIGVSEWSNTARVFDAVRLGLHHGSDRIDVFASSVVINDVDNWDHHQQGNNLHGIYASLGSPIRDAKVEPYALMRTSRRGVNDVGVEGKYHSYTYGTRTSGSFRKVWSYDVDLQGQRGAIAGTPLRAWAVLTLLQRAFPKVKWQPSLLGEFSFASGDRRRGDGEVNTLDQLYPTNHYFYGIADQVARRNAKAVRGALALKPRGWLTVRVEGNGLWLASRYDALYSANGAISVPAIAGGSASTRIGQELDLITTMKVSRYYDIGVQAGRLFAGPFLKAHTKGADRVFYAAYIDFKL